MSRDQFLTLPQIAKRHGVSERQADYAARQFNIEPTARVGIIRVYDAAGEARIKSAIDQVGGNRRTPISV